MNFLPNLKSRHKDPSAPRLIPLDHYPADRIPGFPQPDPADGDLSYEDALADIQFSRFLHSEYDVQAPEESFTRVMSAITASTQPAPAPQPARPTVFEGLRSPGSGFASAFSRPVAARLLSGAVAVAVMAAALVPNMSMVLKDSDTGSLTSRSATISQPYRASRDSVVVPHRKSVMTHTQALIYDRDALLRDDPPDTLVPPIRDTEYRAEPQAPEGPTMLLRKE